MTGFMQPVALGPQLLAADLERQLAHWLAAARTFRDAEEFASSEAWRAVEADVGLPLRKRLHETVEDLIALGERTTALVSAARSDHAQLGPAAAGVQRFRRRYTQVDITLDFFGDAVNSRSSRAAPRGAQNARPPCGGEHDSCSRAGREAGAQGPGVRGQGGRSVDPQIRHGTLGTGTPQPGRGDQDRSAQPLPPDIALSRDRAPGRAFDRLDAVGSRRARSSGRE